MNTFRIASRNVLRNARRSFMTTLAIGVGAISMLLFGEFVLRVFAQLETRSVVHIGHLTVFRKGYFQYGGGNPAAYGIRDYRQVIDWIARDPELKPLINVVTPVVNVFGIAGNFDSEASRTFIGRGVVPADFERMLHWDEHRLGEFSAEAESLAGSAAGHGLVGVGLAQILRLCEPLHLGACPTDLGGDRTLASTSGGQRDFGSLGDEAAQPARSGARLDLLAATAAGAPNVVNFTVDKAAAQGFKELDDAFVAMDFDLAQQLLYGRGERRAIGIVLQLHHTRDIPLARARLERLIGERGLDLEVRDLEELQPFYKQAIGMFSAIFLFISAIMIVIVLFTVVNTMSMSVMERTHEIGTLRAMGVTRSGIALQFVAEGALLGAVGVVAGLLAGAAIGMLVNHAGLTWQPPGQAFPVPLKLMDHELGRLLAATAAGLAAMATVAAWIPARRASRLAIVDALGHV